MNIAGSSLVCQKYLYLKFSGMPKTETQWVRDVTLHSTSVVENMGENKI